MENSGVRRALALVSVGAVLAGALLGSTMGAFVGASSHREAPLIS